MRDDSQDTPYTDFTPDSSPTGQCATQVTDLHDARLAQVAASTFTPATDDAHDQRQPDARSAQPVAQPIGGARSAQAQQQAQQALLRTVYEENLTAVYRFIYSKVGNREEAEDLTSQVFMKALRGMDRARDAQSIQNWLFQVARTTVADHWRAFYRLPSRSLDDLLEAGWEGPSDNANQRLDAPDGDPAEADSSGLDEVATDQTDLAAMTGARVEARAQRILAQLPARYREVLTYRFLLNYSLKETAAQMNLTEANVKVLQFRALKKASQTEFPAP